MSRLVDPITPHSQLHPATATEPSFDEPTFATVDRPSSAPSAPDDASLTQDGGRPRDNSRAAAVKLPQLVSSSVFSRSVDLKQEESESTLKGAGWGSSPYNACLQRCEECRLVLIDHVCPKGHKQQPSMKGGKRLLSDGSDAYSTPSKVPKHSADVSAAKGNFHNPDHQPSSIESHMPSEDRRTMDAPESLACSKARSDHSEDIINESTTGYSSDTSLSSGVDISIADQAYHDLLDDIWRCKICHWEIIANNDNNKYGRCFYGHVIELFKIKDWRPADLCSEDEESLDEAPDTDDESAIDDSEVTEWVFNMPTEMEYETDGEEDSTHSEEKGTTTSAEGDETEEAENEQLSSVSTVSSKVYKMLKFCHLV